MKFYSVHNLAKFALIGHANFCNSKRYSRYETRALKYEELDFSVELCRFNPENDGCVVLDDKYYVKKGYLYCHREQYKMLTWSVELQNLDASPIRVRVEIHNSIGRTSRVFLTLIEGFLIDALIHYSLVRKRHAVIHASCITRNNRGVLFIARGSAGKTVISTGLCKRGFNFVSDNFTILVNDGALYGFAEPMNLFHYNTRPSVKSRLTASEKAKMMMWRIIYRLTGGYLKVFAQIDPYRIFPDYEDQTSLQSAFVLLPKCNQEDITVTRCDRNMVIDRIITNQRMELHFLDKYTQSYSFEFPNGAMSRHWDRYKENLERLLQRECYLIELPSNIDEHVLDRIEEIISDV